LSILEVKININKWTLYIFATARDVLASVFVFDRTQILAGFSLREEVPASGVKGRDTRDFECEADVIE
jgi:hypothetical protein